MNELIWSYCCRLFPEIFYIDCVEPRFSRIRAAVSFGWSYMSILGSAVIKESWSPMTLLGLLSCFSMSRDSLVPMGFFLITLLLFWLWSRGCFLPDTWQLWFYFAWEAWMAPIAFFTLSNAWRFLTLMALVILSFHKGCWSVVDELLSRFYLMFMLLCLWLFVFGSDLKTGFRV